MTPGQQAKADVLWYLLIEAPRELDETFPVSAVEVWQLLESPEPFEDWWQEHGVSHGKENRDFIRLGNDWQVSLNIAATLFMGGQNTPVAMYLCGKMAKALAQTFKDPVKMINDAMQWSDENERLEVLFGGKQ